MPSTLYADRVYESSTSTGTGNFTLAGALTGYQTFSTAFSTNNAYYCIVNRTVPSEWEIGIFTVSTTTLARSAGNVLSGSAGAGTLVTFSAGVKDVFNTLPASMTVAKSGDTLTGQLNGTVFKTTGTAGATGFKIANGTDLAGIFATSAGSGLTGVAASRQVTTGSGNVWSGWSYSVETQGTQNVNILYSGSYSNCNCNCCCCF